MARTKGAKDRTKRKPQCRPSRPKPPATPADLATDERPTLPAEDFDRAIAAELGGVQAEPGQESASSVSTTGATNEPVQAVFDPGSLTLEGLASAWQVPFWALAWGLKVLGLIPDPEPVIAVGKRRAKDLAKPSYIVYEHYARHYLGLNPDNGVHVAAGVTALNGVGIVPEIVEACLKSRRAGKAAAVQGPTGSPLPGVPGGPART